MRLTAYVEPAEIKTLEQDIQKLEQQKEEAIKTEAYEKAGELKKSRKRNGKRLIGSGQNGRRKRLPAS